MRWAAVLLWAAFIFFMSAHTGADLDDGTGLVALMKRWLSNLMEPLVGSGVDVVSSLAHFCEYAVLGALLAAALWHSVQWEGSATEPRRWSVALIAAALASFYGATDEFHQYFVPGRMCDPVDWLVDTAGAAVGVVLFFLVILRLSARSRSACA